MFFYLFFLTYHEINVGNDNFDYLGNTIYQIPRTPLYSNLISNSWYFIQFPYLNNINCKDKLSRETSIKLDSDSIITSRTCLAFLTLDQITNLDDFYKSKQEKVIFRPLLSSEKLHHNDNHFENSYIARFHESFTPPTNLRGNLTKLSNDVYLYQPPTQGEINPTDCLNEILAIPSLRSVSPQKKSTLMNRWNSAFIQKNEWPGGYDIDNDEINASTVFSKGDLRVNRYLNDRGLNGAGQIITIVDSGLDVNSPYFKGKSGELFEYEKVDMNRRKVVYYNCYGNNRDSRDMHGTHVAGIVSGSPTFSEETATDSEKFLFSKQSLYNGVAPSSKVAIVDITTNDNVGTSVLTFPSIALGEAMGKVDSKIALCAWGTNSNVEMSYYYDQLAEHNPSRLFVFAAGNKGPNYMTVTTPGDGKNVLTVGALDPLWTSLYETARAYRLTSGDANAVDLRLLPFGRDLFYSEGFKISDAETSTDAVSDGKVFVTSDASFCEKIESGKNPLAVIFVGESYDESVCQSVSFPFPAFQTKDTSALSFKSVNITVEIPQKVETDISALNVAQYSSRGPNYVGVQKPDVVAPGSSVYSADSTFVSASDGTSNAAAYVTGAAALVYEYFERGFYPTGVETAANGFEPTADLVRALIVASAEPLPVKEDGKIRRGSRTPNSASGHGVVNLENVINFGRNMKVFREIKVSNEQHFFMRFKLSPENGLDLRIVSAYRDPSSTSNILAMQTNIDMYIVLPNGTMIFGNHRPEMNEERFTTVERILLYNDEIREILKTSTSDYFELHFITGTGFSELPHSSIFSLFISGPFVNSETSSESSTTLLQTSTFPAEDKLQTLDDFTFVMSTLPPKCEFPSFGLFCQHNATEIGENETLFNIYANTANIVYLNLPLNYTKIVLNLRREPSFNGRLSLQFAIDNIYDDGRNYPFIVSVYGGTSAIGLGRSMFGPNKFVGIRIANMVGTDVKVWAWMTYEVSIPAATPTQSLMATVPKEVILNVSIGYGLFFFFLLQIIIFSILICCVKRKIKKGNKIKIILHDVEDDEEANQGSNPNIASNQDILNGANDGGNNIKDKLLKENVL